MMAQAFDSGRLELMGEPAMVEEGVEEDIAWWLGVFSVSQNGVLAFAPNQDPGSQLMWLSGTGKRLEGVGEPGRYVSLRVSPDGQQIAVE